MKVLGIDTSTKACSVSIIDEQSLLGEFTLNNNRTHSERLMPLVHGLLSQLQLQVDNLDGIAVARGPGSFTGLRIGMGTAQGLAMGCDLPVIGVTTLDSLAQQRACNGYVCPVMDAKRRQLYTSLYWVENGFCERVWDYQVLSPEELIHKLNETLQCSDMLTFVGDGTAPYESVLFYDVEAKLNYTARELEVNRSITVAKLGRKHLQEGITTPPEELTPLYLRKSEAERKWEDKK